MKKCTPEGVHLKSESSDTLTHAHGTACKQELLEVSLEAGILGIFAGIRQIFKEYIFLSLGIAGDFSVYGEIAAELRNGGCLGDHGLQLRCKKP